MDTKKNIKNTLLAHPLFADCSDSLLEVATNGSRLSNFATGEVIKSYDDKPILCIILSGEVYVHSKDGNADLLLRVLRPGDTLGVATLFGRHSIDPITRVTAAVPTTALCINEETMRDLLMSDAALAMRYIDFLADRIRFLNRRIACLGAGSAEERLCAWLDSVVPIGVESYAYTLRVPMSQLADILGIGRASLYRAFDNLTEQGVLQKDGKVIHIPYRDALRTFGES